LVGCALPLVGCALPLVGCALPLVAARSVTGAHNPLRNDKFVERVIHKIKVEQPAICAESRVIFILAEVFGPRFLH
jgi:hypothetical protein